MSPVTDSYGIRNLPRKGAWIILVVWTLLVGLSYYLNVRQHYKNAHAQAYSLAISHFNKDLAIRLWATDRGGMYLEANTDTPPIASLDFLEHRDVLTSDGKSLTLYDPASALSHLMQRHGDLYGVPSRLVSDAPFNPANLPDAWEQAAIDAFRQGKKEVMEMTESDGQTHLRMMRPLMMQPSCLKCHGFQGFNTTDIRAGIGVSVPMAEFTGMAGQASLISGASHLGFWLIGLVGIGFGYRKFQQSLADNLERVTEMELAARVFENSLQAAFITDAQGRILRVNQMFTRVTGYEEEEAIQATPALLKSGRHDAKFYKEFWHALVHEGQWVGEIWNRRKSGDIFTAWETISSVRDDAGKTHYYISMFQDITDQKEVNDHIYMLAHYDSLTLLPNRQLMSDRINHAIERAKRQKQTLALLFLDLDQFKKINDTLGHGAGDRLLAIAAKRLLSCVRSSDTVARLGGDEFAVLLEDIQNPMDAERIGEKILNELNQPVELEGREWYVGASIGISLFPKDGQDLGMLLRNADTAMYRAKNEGRNQMCFFDESMAEQTALRLAMETALRLAVERGAFTMHYQPQMEIATGRILGVEALIRWQHDGNLVSPADFIPLAEETGLIIPLGQWMLETACREILSLSRELDRELRLAVNISAREISAPGFAQTLAEILERTGMPPQRVEIEITESIAMSDIAKTTHLLEYLSNQGIDVAIDDFGTGHSSLSYLKRLPVDRLKIDRAFVRDTPQDMGDSAIVRTIITMSYTLDLEVVAEGVETQEQLDFLSHEGCHVAQGYFISKPLPLAELKLFLREHDNA